MANQAYFPSSEADRVVWLLHFRAKITVHGPLLGFTDAEVADLIADIDFYVWILHSLNPAAQQFALENTQYKAIIANGTGNDLLPIPSLPVFDNPPAVRLPGVLPRLFNLVQRAKISAGYTEAIGQDLGIIGSQDTTTHPIPDFTASTERGATIERVKIVFTKYGHDGILVESRRNNGAWEQIGIAMVKPWYDERPLIDPNAPEVREYRVRWFDKGEAHGEYSPVQRVTAGP